MEPTSSRRQVRTLALELTCSSWASSRPLTYNTFLWNVYICLVLSPVLGVWSGCSRKGVPFKMLAFLLVNIILHSASQRTIFHCCSVTILPLLIMTFHGVISRTVHLIHLRRNILLTSHCKTSIREVLVVCKDVSVLRRTICGPSNDLVPSIQDEK